jgi:hypothetical protein
VKGGCGSLPSYNKDLILLWGWVGWLVGPVGFTWPGWLVSRVAGQPGWLVGWSARLVGRPAGSAGWLAGQLSVC